MEIYLSMTEHSRVQSVDTDLLYYCAYSLPGVALTLGRANWLLLKPTFSYLAEDLQVGIVTIQGNILGSSPCVAT